MSIFLSRTHQIDHFFLALVVSCLLLMVVGCDSLESREPTAPEERSETLSPPVEPPADASIGVEIPLSSSDSEAAGKVGSGREWSWSARIEQGGWWRVRASASYFQEGMSYTCSVTPGYGRVGLAPYAKSQDSGWTQLNPWYDVEYYGAVTFTTSDIPDDADWVYCWVYGFERSAFSFTWAEEEVQEESKAYYEQFKLPLPGGKSWYLTVEVGGDVYCSGSPDSFHFPDKAYWSLDFDDLSLESGTETDVPVLAPLRGMVIEAKYTDGNGNYVRIDHDEPYDGSGYTTYYLHLKNDMSSLDETFVQQGDSIGVIGTTGVYSTGTHLHFQFKYNGNSSSTASGMDQIRLEGIPLMDYEVGCSPTGYYRSTNN